MRVPKRKSLIIIFTIIALFSSFWCVANIEVSSRQGVNYIVSEKKIPLYVKTLNFLHRHFEYKRLVEEITRGSKTDKEKVLAIFDWTVKNIKKVPHDMPIIDDHVLNIIIRGYGTIDQSADVFTTLCTYMGYPSVMYRLIPRGRKECIIVSAVLLNRRYILFDTYRGNLFLNRNGNLASIDDFRKDPSLASLVKNKHIIGGIPYEDYFNHVVPIEELRTPRAKLQMPFSRIMYEIKLGLGVTKRAILWYGNRPG